MLISVLVLILRALFFASWVPTVYSQKTNATCRSEYVWMTNSLGQNPCLVTAWLVVPCGGTASQVDVLPPGDYYNDPGTSGGPGQCGCNTVIYSLLSACSICQNGELGVDPWLKYSTNCTLATNGSYPEPIPGGTAVPAWAFLDVTRNNTFNVDAAEAVAFQKLPDVTNGGSSTSSVSHSSSASTTTTTDINERSARSKNVGAIVGGVLGAVIGVLLVAVLVFCIMLRSRKQTRGDQSLGSSQTEDVHELPGWVTPSYHVPTLKGETGGVRRFYDPDDPRTYPGAIQSSMAGSGTGYTGLPQVMS